MSIPVDMIVFGLIGAVVGYYLLLRIQIIALIIVWLLLLYISRDANGTCAYTAYFFWLGAACVGVAVGDLIYYIPHITVNFFIPISTSWFIR